MYKKLILLLWAALLLPATMKAQTACIDSLPWTADFSYMNNSTAGHLSEGWVRVMSSTQSNGVVFPRMSGYSITFSTPDSNENLLASPCFDPIYGYLHITFRACWMSPRIADSLQYIEVGVMTDTLSPSQFYPLHRVMLGNSLQDYDLYLAPPTSFTRVGFRFCGGVYHQATLRNLIVSSALCLPPAGTLTADSVGSSVVRLRWAPSYLGSTDSYVVSYKRTSDAAWLHMEAISDTICTIERLIPMSDYQFKVGTLCGNDTVYQIHTLNLTTPCGSYATPFYEDFSTNVNSCWHKSSTLTRGNSRGDYYMSFGGATSTTTPVLMTPYIDAPVDQWRVTIAYRGTSPSFGLMTLGVIDGNDSVLAHSDTIGGNEGYYSPDATLFREYIFPNVPQSGCRLAIFGKALKVYSIEILASSCPPVDAIMLDAVTDHSADISLTGAGDNFRVCYSAGDFADTIVIPDYAFTIDSLQPMTRYRLQVYPICDDSNEACYSPVLSFRTLRGEVTLPYIETFEGCETDSIPDAWTRLISHIASGQAYPAIVEDNTAHGGSRYLKFNSVGTETGLIVTPRLPSAPQGYLVSFWIRGTSDFVVGTIDTTLNPNSFVAAQTYSHNIAFENNWYRYELRVGNSNTRHIAFMHSTYSGIYGLDDIEIHAYGQCAVPQLTDLSATDHSLSLSWNPTGASSYQVCYALINSMADADTLTVSTATANIGSLVPNTLYHLWIRSVCGAGDTSAWNWLGTYRTDCLPMTIPYTEDFETANEDRHPNCWYALGDSIWNYYLMRRVRIDTGGMYGSKALLLLSGDYYEKAYAVTDRVPLAPDSIGVTFRLKGSDVWYTHFSAGVMTDPTNFSTFVPLLDTVMHHGSWSEYSFNTFGHSFTAPLYVAFCVIGQGSVLVDDVRIDSVPDAIPVCHAARGLRINAVGSTTVNLSWITTGTSYEVAVLDADSNLLWNVQHIDSNHVTLTGLQPLTSYRFALRTLCSGDSTAWTPTVSTTTNCPDNYPLPWGEDFNNVTHLPDCWNIQSEWPLNASYDNHTFSNYFWYNEAYLMTPVLAAADTVKISFRMKMTHPAHMQVGLVFPNSNLSSFVAHLDTSTSQQSSSADLWSNVQVLCTPGGNDFRLAFHFFENGRFEIDDILVSVYHTVPPQDPTPECHVPTELTVTDVDSTSATVSWTPGGNESRWELLLETSGNTTPRQTTDNPFILMGLSPSTSYILRVRALCSDTLSSDYSQPVFFTAGDAVGIQGFGSDGAQVYVRNGNIVVAGAQGQRIGIYDMMGRCVSLSTNPQTAVPASGVYMVKIEGVPVKKVVVVK